MKLQLLSLLTCLFLAGCATQPVENMNSQIQPNIPAKWSGKGESVSSDISWIDSLGDQKLTGVVQSAIENSHLLRSSLAQMSQMDARARLAGAAKYPMLNLNFSSGKAERVIENVGIVQTDTNSLGLSSQWQIDLWGITRDKHASVLARLEAAGYRYEDLVLTVAGSISKAWFAVIEANLQYELAVQIRDSYDHQLNTLEDRYLKGLVNAFDLRVFRAQSSQNNAVVTQRKLQLDTLKRQLQVLLSEYPDGDVVVEGELDLALNSIPASLKYDVLTRRPDLRSAERELAASMASKKATDKNRLPNLQVTGTFGTSSSEIDKLLDGDRYLWSFIGGLTAPLFSAGRLEAERDLASAQFDQQLELYKQQVLEAFREVEVAVKSDEFLDQILAEISIVVDEIKDAEAQAWDLYNRGMNDITAVLDVQRSSANAQSQLLQYQFQRIQNRIDLHIAIGGSF